MLDSNKTMWRNQLFLFKYWYHAAKSEIFCQSNFLRNALHCGFIAPKAAPHKGIYVLLTALASDHWWFWSQSKFQTRKQAQLTLEGVQSPGGPSRHWSFAKHIVRAVWYKAAAALGTGTGEQTPQHGRETRWELSLHLPQLPWKGSWAAWAGAGGSELPTTSQGTARHTNTGIISHITRLSISPGGNTPHTATSAISWEALLIASVLLRKSSAKSKKKTF